MSSPICCCAKSANSRRAKAPRCETLIERGQHRVIADARSGAPFKLRRASFRGQGLQPEFRHAPWDRLRDAAYEDHGA